VQPVVPCLGSADHLLDGRGSKDRPQGSTVQLTVARDNNLCERLIATHHPMASCLPLSIEVQLKVLTHSRPETRGNLLKPQPQSYRIVCVAREVHLSLAQRCKPRWPPRHWQWLSCRGSRNFELALTVPHY